MTARNRLFVTASALALGLFGCSSSSTAPAPTPPPQALYAANFGATPPLAEVLLPFSATSTVTTLSPAALSDTVDVAFDSASNLYVSTKGTQVLVFAHPVTNASVPVATINMPAGGNDLWIALDSQNDLWVEDSNNLKVYKFTPPFSGTITPTPAVTLSTGLPSPTGIAFDGAGNLYVGNDAGNIQIFTAPILNNASPTATPLTGATTCRGIAFDQAGNLYAGSFSGAIERYNFPTAGGGAPSIIDPNTITTLAHAYFLAIDAQGNLYASDSLITNKIYQFTAVASTFSATSAPATSLAIGAFTSTSGMAFGPP
jgi:hypothetical protein